MIETCCFYLLAVVLLSAGFKAVTSPYVLRSAVYLIVALLSIAGLYLLLNAEFPAAVQILVYVGGIVVVIVFAILLISDIGEALKKRQPLIQALAAIFVALFVSIIVILQYTAEHNPANTGLRVDPSIDSTTDIGRSLLSTTASGFILPFELISLLLLAVLIGAIVVARSKPGSTSATNLEQDVNQEPLQKKIEAVG